MQEVVSTQMVSAYTDDGRISLVVETPMRWHHILLLTLVGSGTLSFLGIFGYARLAEKNRPSVPVLVAKKPLPQWTTLRYPSEELETRLVPEREVPQNVVPASTIDDLKGRRLRSTVQPGTILTEDHLTRKGMAGIGPGIVPGKRAISIRVTPEQVTGSIEPGSKVDVVHTFEGTQKVLLDNVLLLAIDLATDRPPSHATATLQLDDPEQEVKLAAPRDKGTLNLVMRRGDADDEEKKVRIKP